VFNFFGAFTLMLVFKQMHKIYKRLFFPFVDLGWVYVVLGRDQGNALVFSYRFQNDLRLLAGCAACSDLCTTF
jgi:hypothetical protein